MKMKWKNWKKKLSNKQEKLTNELSLIKKKTFGIGKWYNNNNNKCNIDSVYDNI